MLPSLRTPNRPESCDGLSELKTRACCLHKTSLSRSYFVRRKNEPLSRPARLISRGYFFMANDAIINKRINERVERYRKKFAEKLIGCKSVCRTNISSDGLSEKSAEPTYLRAIIYYLSHIAEIEGSTDEFPSDKSYHFEL